MYSTEKDKPKAQNSIVPSHSRNEVHETQSACLLSSQVQGYQPNSDVIKKIFRTVLTALSRVRPHEQAMDVSMVC